MTKIASVSDIFFECIWNYANQMRGVVNASDLLLPVVYVLYGMHKGYDVTKTDNDDVLFDGKNDMLLQEILQNMSVRSHVVSMRTYSLYNSLHNIDRSSFEENYVDVLTKVLDQFQTLMGKESGEFITPIEVVSLLVQIISDNNCNSIYDPFCGSASIASKLPATATFAGQDLETWASILAKVMLDASVCKGEIGNVNSLTTWSERHFDAVVTCPPFNLMFRNEHVKTIIGLKEYPARTVEDIVFYRSLLLNRVDVLAVLEPMGFAFAKSRMYQLRKFLVDYNFLDTVIALPRNILYGTSISSIIVVCKNGRKSNEPVKFIDARTYFIDNGRRHTNRRLDIKRFEVDSLSKPENFYTEVDNKRIKEYDYNVSPDIYVNESINIGQGQRVVKLSELITPTPGVHVNKDFKGNIVTPSLLNNDFIRIILNKDSATENTTPSDRRLTQYGEEGKSYLLVIDTPYELSKDYGLMTTGNTFVCKSPIKVFEINTSLVSPEYAVLAISQDRKINLKAMPILDSLSLSLVIDEGKDKQAKIVNQIKQEYAIKEQQEQEADAKRLGVKRNVSDLEHMLGTPRFKVEQILRRLERATSDNERVSKLVTSLKDNIEYMNRLVRFTNSNMSAEDFNLKQGDITEFIRSYVNGWNNYGDNYFRLSIKNEVECLCLVVFDKTMLTVMLDSILGNAARHGFHKRKNYTPDNEVEINLSLREFNNKPYVLIEAANNGDPLPEGFTIQDYITKGRYDAESGRSGLGGYHVYQIVKGHKGYLYIDSNKIWNTIIDILLPVEKVNIENLVPYEQKCI